jgi:transposase
MALSAGNQLLALAMIEMEGLSCGEAATQLKIPTREVEVLHQRYSEEGLGQTLRSSPPTANGSARTCKPRSPGSGKRG